MALHSIPFKTLQIRKQKETHVETYFQFTLTNYITKTLPTALNLACENEHVKP